MKMFFRSVAVGIVLALALGALAFALARFFDAVGVYITPATLLEPVIEPLIPSAVVYWLVPDGGAPAALLLILVCTLLFWTTVFGVAHFAWASLRCRRATQKTTGPKS
jgi:hypothetical protein